MTQSTASLIKSRVESSQDLTDLYIHIQEDLNKVEDQLRDFTSSQNKLISEISNYLFQKGGKRIRPALLVLCSKLFGYQGKEHIFMSSLVETIHTASLIHDDIIDNSDIRRGRESVHSRWGPNITVLLGDYLYIKSIGLSLHSKYPQFIQILTDVSARMIDGELTEYYMSSNLDMPEEDYLDIINKKTASLFGASCQIGAILGGTSEKVVTSLQKYGENFGMCFQIIDDLLDFTGDEKIMGKPILSDLSEGRITLPLIFTLNHDGQANRRHIADLMRKKDRDMSSLNKVLEIVKANGALDYTFNKAEEFSNLCREIIAELPESIHREALSLFSEYILKRQK